MTRLVLFFVSVVLLGTPVFGQSCVWKVSRGESVLYVGGTLHLLRKSDYPLPREFDKAYDASDAVAFEIDMTEMFDPATQVKLARAGQLPAGQTLEKLLSPEVVAMVKKSADAVGIPFVALNRMRPAMAMMAISMTQLARKGVNMQGVDAAYHQRAKKDKRKQLALESFDDQINMLIRLSDTNPDELMKHTIEDLERVGEIMDKIIAAWRVGDRKALNEQFVAEFVKDYPKLYDQVFRNRNLRWMKKFEAYLKTDEVEFVMFGAGHLVGPDGVLKLLEDAGCTLEQIHAGESKN